MRKIIFSILFLLSIHGYAQIADSSMREVKLQGAVNFRDMGGYATKDGHHVKWNKIYRSADISKLTDNDLAILSQRKIDYDVDLRGVEESKKAPDHINPNTDYILCPAGSDANMNDWMKSIAGLKSGGDSMMLVFYSKTEFLADRYRPFFEKLIALPDQEALVFHCTAGKDRTGIGAALLLFALGVPYETISDDYVATNYYRRNENEKAINAMVQYMHINEGVAKDMLGTKKEYLDKTFNAIRLKYGSIENFIKNQMGFDDVKLALLKKKLLD